jgi:hypothetical protein
MSKGLGMELEERESKSKNKGAKEKPRLAGEGEPGWGQFLRGALGK